MGNDRYSDALPSPAHRRDRSRSRERDSRERLSERHAERRDSRGKGGNHSRSTSKSKDRRYTRRSSSRSRSPIHLRYEGHGSDVRHEGSNYGREDRYRSYVKRSDGRSNKDSNKRPPDDDEAEVQGGSSHRGVDSWLRKTKKSSKRDRKHSDPPGKRGEGNANKSEAQELSAASAAGVTAEGGEGGGGGGGYGRMIEVVCNDRLGKKIRVKCDPDDLVGDLKKLIAAQTGTHPQKIVLKKWYTIFKDHIRLSDYEINDGMNLELYYR